MNQAALNAYVRAAWGYAATARLEDEFGPQLNFARSRRPEYRRAIRHVRSPAGCAEQRRRGVSGGRSAIRGSGVIDHIQNIKHFGSELSGDAFLDGPVLGDGEIQVMLALAPESIARDITKRTLRGRYDYGPIHHVAAKIAQRPTNCSWNAE